MRRPELIALVLIVPMIAVYFYILGRALLRAVSQELGWMHMATCEYCADEEDEYFCPICLGSS